MKQLKQLFEFRTARSGGVDDYGKGETPFVTSTEMNNGVVAYVLPDDEDRVFQGPAIAISGLGFATVHLKRFLPKGNGGDSLTILKPKGPMKVEQLISIASSFNALHQWRFSYGRKCSISRLEALRVPYPPQPVSAMWTREQTTFKELASGIEKGLNDDALPFPEEELFQNETDNAEEA